MKKDENYYLSKVKKSEFADFYRKNLKHIYIINAVSKIFWNVFLPRILKYIEIIGIRSGGKVCALVNLEKISGVVRWDFSEAGSISIKRPDIYPIALRGVGGALVRNQPVLGFYIKKIESASVIGGSNMFLSANKLIHHDLYNFKTDYTSEELHGRMLLKPFLNKARISNIKSSNKLVQAAIFTDACASNYAHWLTEVLPRIVIFCAIEDFSEVPLIVDGGLHANIMSSLRIIAGDDRDIIKIDKSEHVDVDVLYVTSPSGYIPFERRGKVASYTKHGVFSSDCLRSLRNRMFDALNLSDEASEKIYIKRNSGYRLIENHLEVERFLLSLGYIVLEPEKLSFAEQVACFSSAKIVVGATGAAFANLIFAPKDSQMVILFPHIDDSAYLYWQNIAQAVDVTVSYVLGEVTSEGGAHSNFRIDVSELERLLSHLN